MIVMKFGGSSVRDAERIQYVSELIKANLSHKPLIVSSALGKTTDNLIKAGQNALKGNVSLEEIREHHLETARQLDVATYDIEALFAELDDLLKGISLLKELSAKTMDHLLSFGERLAVRIIAVHLSNLDIPARACDGWEIGFRTNSNFNSAEIEEATFANIAEYFSPFKNDYPYTPVITGFIAKDKDGNITTLGRGGSDLTASVVGAAMGVEEIQVWKDVDGILTTDPRIVKSARPVANVSFEEASELAYFGAKVLHPSSIQPAMAKNIPVRVKNSYNPEHCGTLITRTAANQDDFIKAITSKRNITLIDIVSTRMLGQYGFLAKVFQIFNDHKVSVDMVATSEISVSLTLNNGANLEQIEKELQAFSKVKISRGKSILSLVGNVSRSSEILDAAFGILSELGVNVQMISQGASKVNIGLIVEDDQVDDCIRRLHEHFFERDGAAA